MHDDEEIAKHSRQAFADQEQQLDQEVVKRLQEIRQQAVDVARQRQRGFAHGIIGNLGELILHPGPGMRPAYLLGALSIAVLIVSVTLNMQYRKSAPIDDLAILSSGDDFEVIQNLDFYDWLQDVDGNG